MTENIIVNYRNVGRTKITEKNGEFDLVILSSFISFEVFI